MITKEVKTQVISENAVHEGDTGSPEVQIAILTPSPFAWRPDFLGAPRETH